MAKISGKNGRAVRSAGATKYDAHHKVLSTTYGSFADLRRELADSKEKVAEREAVLKLLGSCADPQRAYLLFDDYLEKLSLRRNRLKPGTERSAPSSVADGLSRRVSPFSSRKLAETRSRFWGARVAVTSIVSMTLKPNFKSGTWRPDICGSERNPREFGRSSVTGL